MELNYKSVDGRYNVKFTGSDVKDLFEQIARFSEIMETNLICGNCKSEDTRLAVRVIEDNKYYQRNCNRCGFSFAFGQAKKGGGLFPKWATGWTKYDPAKKDNEVDPFESKKVSPKKV